MPVTSNFEAVTESIDTFLLDCDGVLWRGSQLLPNIAETIQQFRMATKRIFFVTNNASKSRREYVAKFTQLGIQDVIRDEIISSAYAAAAYFASLPMPPSGRVLVLGAPGLVEELRDAGRGGRDMDNANSQRYRFHPLVVICLLINQMRHIHAY